MTFLKCKRVVVTGGAGFLAQPVCRALERFDPAMPKAMPLSRRSVRYPNTLRPRFEGYALLA